MDENSNNRHKSHSVTIFDIAREAGVSYSTVSRVLNGFEFVKDSTRQRVMEAAERLSYVANPQARSLAGGHSQIIGVLVPGLDNGYLTEVVRGIDLELTRANYDLMMYTTHRHVGKESSYVNTITNGLTDGLLLVIPLVTTQYLNALQDRGFPYVLIDQSDATGRSPTVETTNWQGAYDATRYLIEQGHRRIALITGLMEVHSAVDRLEGYKAALEDYNIPFCEELVVPGEFLHAGGYAATQKLLALTEPPTAIFASNDLEAFGAMEAIRERGLQIPNDISIVGFDNIPQASIVYPKLTTVQQPLEQMGRMGVRLLLEQIENPERPPRRITLSTQLIVRDSCRSWP